MRFVALVMAALGTTVAARNCGLKIAPCPQGQECVPNEPKCTDLNMCLGTCQRVPPSRDYQRCGGNARPPLPPCAKGTTCRDDPRVPGCGVACDRQGICIPDKAPRCGGLTGRKCPGGRKLQCYDFPNDDCDPENGGADCIGVCLKPLP